MKTSMFAIAAAALLVAQGSAFAAKTSYSTATATDPAYVQRMALVGRTVRPGETPPAPVSANSDVALTAEQRQQQYVERMKLIGRTVQANEQAPGATSEDKPADSYATRVQQYEKRMALIGRTVQPSELDALASTNRERQQLSAQRQDKLQAQQ